MLRQWLPSILLQFLDYLPSCCNGYPPSCCNGYSPSCCNGCLPFCCNVYLPSCCNCYLPSCCNGYLPPGCNSLGTLNLAAIPGYLEPGCNSCGQYCDVLLPSIWLQFPWSVLRCFLLFFFILQRSHWKFETGEGGTFFSYTVLKRREVLFLIQRKCHPNSESNYGEKLLRYFSLLGFICKHTHTHTHTHTCTHTHIHTHTHAHTDTDTDTNTHTHTHNAHTHLLSLLRSVCGGGGGGRFWLRPY